MSLRGEAMSACDAFLRAAGKIDELETTAATVKRDLAATMAEHEQEKARLASIKATAAEAEAAHEKWLRVTGEVRLKTNTEIDQLQGRLAALQSAVAEKRAEHDNIVSGLQALHTRLRV